MATWLIYGLCILLLRAPEAFPKRRCTPKDVLDYLNLTKNNEKFTTCRPVLDWTHSTDVYLDTSLVAILSVIEKSQIFVSCLWMSVTWNNELISWNPEDFCGITRVSLPREMLWKPDLSIFEFHSIFRTAGLVKCSRTEKDSHSSPYLSITHDGKVVMEEELKIVNTCKMDLHKFPFDTQRCQITVVASIHTSKEVRLFAASNSSKMTRNSRELLLTQGEWELLGMTVSEDNLTIFESGPWDLIKYTVSVRRMPLLHVLNFQLPVLFFLALDLASFFIPVTSGDKLSFKVTVLLAISVLLLILNDILPSKSDQSPLIATYVIFIFAFMLLSLLETILVTYLIEMDSSEKQVSENKQDGLLSSLNGDFASQKDAKRRQGSDDCVSSGGNSSSKSMTELDGADTTGELRILQMILEQLQALRLNVSALAPKPRSRYWSRVAKRIDAAFFVFYFGTVFLFLVFISLEWMK